MRRACTPHLRSWMAVPRRPSADHPKPGGPHRLHDHAWVHPRGRDARHSLGVPSRSAFGDRLAQLSKLVPKYLESLRGGRDSKTAETYDSGPTHVDSRQLDATRVDVSARELVTIGQKKWTVEDALARAIEGAVSAERWDVVAQLAKELEARRLAASASCSSLMNGQSSRTKVRSEECAHRP